MYKGEDYCEACQKQPADYETNYGLLCDACLKEVNEEEWKRRQQSGKTY